MTPSNTFDLDDCLTAMQIAGAKEAESWSCQGWVAGQLAEEIARARRENEHSTKLVDRANASLRVRDEEIARLRAALERVCAVDKSSPGRKDCDIWAEMLAEAAEALRATPANVALVRLRYDLGGPGPTDEQRAYGAEMPLYRIGDAVLVWVNEGDLYALGEDMTQR